LILINKFKKIVQAEETKKHEELRNTIKQFRQSILDSGRDFRYIFSVIDKDNNGVLSPEEIRSAFILLGIEGNPDAVIEFSDSNKDGMIDYDEFWNFIYQTESEMDSVIDKMDTSRQELIEEIERYNEVTQNRSFDFEEDENNDVKIEEENQLDNEENSNDKDEVPKDSIKVKPAKNIQEYSGFALEEDSEVEKEENVDEYQYKEDKSKSYNECIDDNSDEIEINEDFEDDNMNEKIEDKKKEDNVSNENIDKIEKKFFQF